MKRIILGLLLITASIQVKAQQSLQTTPDLKLNNGLQNLFKPQATPSPKSLLLQPVNTKPANSNNIIVYSKMPVVKVSGTDRMPVAVLGSDPNTKYTMLIKKVEINSTPTTATPQP